jgi:hypothetical protein
MRSLHLKLNIKFLSRGPCITELVWLNLSWSSDRDHYFALRREEAQQTVVAWPVSYFWEVLFSFNRAGCFVFAPEVDTIYPPIQIPEILDGNDIDQSDSSQLNNLDVMLSDAQPHVIFMF